MPDQFADFDLVDDGDDEFSGFESIDRKPKKKPAPQPNANLPSLGRDSVVRAVDGDTLRTGAGRSVRLWGADAPERGQSGWDRSGRTVPIGEMSLSEMAKLVSNAQASFGEPVHTSYGRPVASLSLNGEDAGQSMLRSGNALAAPEYISDAPTRLSDYMEAERLARLNGLGMHGTFHQTPAEHRRNPDYVPEREEVARFWDTPTPFAGLRPEIEAGYLDVTKSGTADEIMAFAKANGFTIDPDETRRFVADRDGGANVDWRIGYKDKPKPLTDLGDGRKGATIRGLGDGVLAGGLDEVGAVADSLGLTPHRENIWNSDRRLADVWANNQQQNSAILGYDEMAHPGYRLSGQIAGGLVAPFGSKARTVPQLFRVGAAYGGAEGFLGTDGDVGQRAIGAAVGVPIGGAVGAAGGKALELGIRAAPKLGRMVRGNTWGSGPNKGIGRPHDGISSQASKYDQTPEVPNPVRAGDVGDVWDGQFDGPLPPPPDGARIDPIGMDADSLPSISQPVRQRDYLFTDKPVPMDQPLTDAQRQAMAQDIDPRDVLPIMSNEVGSVEEAAAIDLGRAQKATASDEYLSLSSRGVKAQTGTIIPKRGPLDLVTWLRSQGGIKDQGGELRAMGIGNDGRDMDFARGEQRFGRLVDDENGMNLDDAAFRAWEAGYLPGTERPDIDAFLDAVNRTHSGSERFYLPEDMAEVAQFEGMRADRIALEQQQANGPVYVDRSVPADDQPFAPPEAYEEWPAGGPDFAGNINLGKLDSPQDIARALDMTQRRVGFDAATRGRVSQAETERLAADLNMTSETLLSRRQGQAFNAEEALAARQILAKSGNELVNAAKRIRQLDDPGDELLADFRQKWVRHVAIQEQVAGMTAEAGRALQQFKQGADSRAVRGDVLSALVRAGGGRDGLKEAAEVLIDAVEMGPGKFNAFAEKARQPKWRHKLGELYVNFLLSNPPTHVVNMVSNMATAMLQVPEYATASMLGAARGFAKGKNAKPRILGSEVGARAYGLLQGTKEGAQLFAKALRSGEADDFVTKVEGDEYKAISGVKGEIIRIPTRLLTAEDQFFKGIARRMAINGLAARKASREGLKGDAFDARVAELSADPTDDMFEEALDYGRYLTFQRKTGAVGQSISRIANDNLLGKIVAPFVRTPINLMKFATERSPGAPLQKEWRDDFRAGGERRDLAIARMMLGTGFATLMYQAALDGRITGAAPSDPRKSRLLYADGWQPYSVKIGDRYISYSRLDPLSTTIGVAADLATLPEGMSERQRDDKMTLLLASIMGNLASKTWLSGVSEFVSALHEPDRNAGNWLERVAGAFAVPGGVAGVARAIDPVSRKRESIGEAIQARVPGVSSGLLPRRDVFGEAIENDSLGPDVLSPFWQSKARNDPVISEMLRIEKSVSAPGKQYTEDGERLDYTPEQYDRYHEIAGRFVYNGLFGLLASNEYRSVSDAERRKLATKAITKARKSARELLDDPDYPLPAKATEGDATDAPDEWSDFEAVKPTEDEWSGFESVDQADIMGDLRKAIPGVRFTSGFRTPEYQAEMRRRGYKPASNSAHLDGSALDMLPPPGKSMGWLKAQVKRFNPKARLLIHDGHLHATFPGWYGAPVLGGAKAAGLRNPMSVQ